MTRTLVLILLASLAAAPVAYADHDGRPHDPREDPCKQREKTCTDVAAGTMECMPETGVAEDLAIVVGSEDSGTFQLQATGLNHPGGPCTFEIRVHADQITFNEGWTVGLLAPYGGAGNAASTPCTTFLPGEACTTTASFTWWRAQHGVTFDVPYELVVNGVVVAEGSCHYYDPPALEAVTGGPVSV